MWNPCSDSKEIQRTKQKTQQQHKNKYTMRLRISGDMNS